MNSQYAPVVRFQKNATTQYVSHEPYSQTTKTPNHMKPTFTKIRQLLVGTIMAAAISLEASAAVAVPDTLTNYLALGAGGATIGSTLFSNFTILSLQAGATAINPNSILVTPINLAGNVGFQFSLNQTANTAQIFELHLGYKVASPSITGATTALNGSIVNFDGANTGLLTLTGAMPTQNLIAFDIGVASDNPVSGTFASLASLTAETDFVVDGGTFGGARLTSGTNLFAVPAVVAVPEPGSAMAGMGVLGMCMSGLIRRKRKPSGAAGLLVGAVIAGILCFSSTPKAQASSHSDAPLIKLDPQANLSDVYAFVRTRPSGERVLVVEVNVHPFGEPGDGLMFDAFSPDALYSIHIANPVTGAELQRYDFQFSGVNPASGSYKNTNTILRYGRGADIAGSPDVGSIATVGDAHQNFVQSYAVSSLINGTRTNLTTTPLLVAPPNVGKKTTPLYNDANGRAISGAATRAALDPYTAQTTVDVVSGANTYTMFAGPRDDSFFADVPGISDLLDARILGTSFGQAGGGVDGFKGFNVMHYAIVIPLTALPSVTYTGALQPTSTGVGVYASVSRPRITLRQSTSPDVSSGSYVQVNRLANPLFNEVLVALADKDNYNRSLPTGDAASFAKYALNPEIAVLINAVFGTNFQTTGRVDLQAIFIPDVIRVNTTTGAIRTAGQAGFNRLSFIGGDTIANGAGTQIPSGWPNGRRFGDDVVDIALTAIASGPSFTTITTVGDNVPANDTTYNLTFPYAATPNSGTRNSKDSGVNVGF